MKKKSKKAKWTEQELQLLAQSYPLFASKRWKRIAEVFQQKGFRRTEIQCREKWINCVDPDLKNNQWEDEQLRKLYEIQEQVGTKWCVIQKYVGKTQNKIKNRFYGTLRNYVRFVINYLQSEKQKSYNLQIGKIAPKLLHDIYIAQNHFRFLGSQVKDTIFQMRYKIERNIMIEKIQSQKPLYKKLRDLIVRTFKSFKITNKLRRTYRIHSEEEPIIKQENDSDKVIQIIDLTIVKKQEQEQIKIEVMESNSDSSLEALRQMAPQPPRSRSMASSVPASYYPFPFMPYPYPHYPMWPSHPANP